VETFECYNGVFRGIVIHGNRLAVSRDCARRFRGFDRMKHLLCGGYFQNGDGIWAQAGTSVQHLLHEHPVLQRHLGWAPRKPAVAGMSCAAYSWQ
jgi:hypothetical protein